MSDFFDRLEHELKAAVRRAGPDAAPVARARPSLGGLVVVLASVAAVAVAVVAIVVTGRGARAPTPASRASSSPGSACTRRLLDGLAVLRRPQTRADREFQPPAQPARESGPTGSAGGSPLSGWSGGVAGHGYAPLAFTPVPALTRLARTLPDGRRVYFEVLAPSAAGPGAQIGDTLQVYLADPATGKASLETEVISGAFLATEYEMPPLPSSDRLYLSLVPDGVARVVWRFPTVRFPRYTEPGGHVLPGSVTRGATVTAGVQGNIAAAIPPRPVGFASSATWLAPDGRVVKSARFPVVTPPAHLPTGRKTITSTGTARGAPISAAC